MTLEEFNASEERNERFMEVFGYEYHDNCPICKALWDRLVNGEEV